MRSETKRLREAIVLSTHTMGYGVIKSLGIMHVPVIAVYYNKSDMGYLSKYVQKSFKTVSPIKNEDLFIEHLLSIGRQLDKPVLFPANDDTLVVAAKYKKDLEKYFIVACTDYTTMSKFISKENTYHIAEEIGIPLAKTLYPSCSDDLKTITKNLAFPFIIKPLQSHLYFDLFRKKMVVVHNEVELETEYKKIIDNNLNCVIQEYIPGDESQGYNFNSYRYRNSLNINFTARKVRYSENGLGIPTCVISTENVIEIKEYSLKLLNNLNYYGYSCLEYKYDHRDNKFKLMEMNGRHNRSTLLSLRCGINFPWIEYCDYVFNERISESTYQKNVYWIDFFKDLESLPKRIKEGYNLKEFFRPYYSQHIFSEISFSDIRPTVKRLLDSLSVIISKFLTQFNHLSKRKAVLK